MMFRNTGIEWGGGGGGGEGVKGMRAVSEGQRKGYMLL